MTTIAEYLQKTTGDFEKSGSWLTSWWRGGVADKQMGSDLDIQRSIWEGLKELPNNAGEEFQQFNTPEFVKQVRPIIRQTIMDEIAAGNSDEEAIKAKVQQVVSKQMLQTAFSNPEWALNKIYQNMPPEQAAAIQERVKTDPALAHRLVNEAREAAGTAGDNFMSDPKQMRQLMDSIGGNVANGMMDYTLSNMDMVDDSVVPKGMNEQRYLETQLFGDDPAFNGVLSKYYDPANPHSSSQVILGLLNDFKDPDSPLRLAAIDHYRKLPEDQKENAMLAQWIRASGELAAGMGQTTFAKQLNHTADNLNSMLGSYGQTFYGNEDFDQIFGTHASNAWNALSPALKYNQTVKQWTPRDAATTNKLNDYAQGIRAMSMDDRYFGMLADPRARNFVQYAGPMAAYGGAAAMMGSPLAGAMLAGSGLMGLYGANATPSWANQNPGMHSLMTSVKNTISMPFNFMSNYLPAGINSSINSMWGPQTQTNNANYLSPGANNNNSFMNFNPTNMFGGMSFGAGFNPSMSTPSMGGAKGSTGALSMPKGLGGSLSTGSAGGTSTKATP